MRAGPNFDTGFQSFVYDDFAGVFLLARLRFFFVFFFLVVDFAGLAGFLTAAGFTPKKL